MRLGDLLDVEQLRDELAAGTITRRNHPTLPMAILNYTNECLFDNYWPDVVQKCRGLIINPVHDHEVCGDCEVISRPFHKFFNLNHVGQPEYQEPNLPNVVPTVTEKMDGWFGIMWKCGDQYGVASRGSFDSPGAIYGTDKLRKLVKYGAVEEFPKGYTPIFEIIFKQGKIVVDYPFEGLVLLGLVNNETGEELPYDELRNVWAKIASYSCDNRPWIRLVHAHNMTRDECQNYTKKNFEGFVLTYPRPGTWPIKVKVKLEEYKRLHRLITGVTPQQIWKNLHDPVAQWMEGSVPDSFRKWVIQWRDQLYQDFQKRLATIMRTAQEVHAGMKAGGIDDNDRATLTLMLELANPEDSGIALSLLDGKIYEAHQAIWKRVRPVGREHDVFYREGQGE